MADKIKVVLIDDEQDLCFVVKANLEDIGDYEVVTCSAPLQAEEVIRQANPDVILLDVVMPERKGTEVVESLRKDPALKKIPVILVSGKGEMVYNRKKDEFKWMPNNPAVVGRGDLPSAKGAEALANAYGVADYISKPFMTDVLVEVINEVVQRYKRKPLAEEDGAA